MNAVYYEVEWTDTNGQVRTDYFVPYGTTLFITDRIHETKEQLAEATNFVLHLLSHDLTPFKVERVERRENN